MEKVFYIIDFTVYVGFNPVLKLARAVNSSYDTLRRD